MAAGDYLNPSVLDGGQQCQAKMDGMDGTGITRIEPGKSIALTVTSKGYNGSTDTTYERTIDAYFNSAEDESSDLFSDDFVTDTTQGLETYDAAYTVHSGAFSVLADSDKLSAETGTGPWYATRDLSATDVRIVGWVDPITGSEGAGFVLRWIDSNNFIRVRVRAGNGDQLVVEEMVDGNLNIIDNPSLSMNDNERVKFTITLVGTQIDVLAERYKTFKEDEQTAGGTVSNTTGTRHGFYASVEGNRWTDWDVDEVTGDAIVTFDLAEPVFGDDTSVLLTADEGALTDGVVTSNATTDQAVDNSANTRPYGSCGLWPISKYPDRYTGSFTVEAEATAPPMLAHPGEAGIAAVTATITDAGAYTTAVQTATAWTSITESGGFGWHSRFPAFKFDFNAQDRGDGQPFAKGLATVELKAYPMIGDAASVHTMTYQVYLDPADAYDTKIAYMDTTSDLALSSGDAANFTAWEQVTGETSGAKGVVVGPQSSGSTLLITLLTDIGDETGDLGFSTHFQAGETITGDESGATATVGSADVPSNGRSRTGGTLGDPNDPYFYPGIAARACQDASAEGKASFSELRYLRGGIIGGNYKIDGTQYGTDTSDGPLIVRPDDGVDASLVRFVKQSYYGAYGFYTSCVEVRDVLHWRNTWHTTVIPNNQGQLAEGELLILDGVDMEDWENKLTDVTVDPNTDVWTSPGVPIHRVSTGTRINLHSTGTLPGGTSGGDTDYYFRPVDLQARTFTLHPTPADAEANTNVVDVTDAGSGSHTVWTHIGNLQGGFDNVYIFRSRLRGRDGGTSAKLVRSCTLEHIGNDLFTWGSDSFAVNCDAPEVEQVGDNHQSVAQITSNRSNVGIFWSRTMGHGIAGPFTVQSSGLTPGLHAAVGYVHHLISGSSNQRRESPFTDLIEIHCTYGQNTAQSPQYSGVDTDRHYHVGCVFADAHDIPASPLWATRYCHEIANDSLTGLTSNSGGETLADLFVDPANGDYTPKQGASILRMPRIMSMDAAGTSVVNDGTAALGALQPVSVPVLAVEDSGGNAIADGGTFPFGSVAEESDTSEQFTLRNTGSADLTINTITVSGDVSIDAADDPSDTTVAAGGSTTMTVKLATADSGSKTGQVSIPSNDANSPYDLNFTAEVQAAGYTTTLTPDATTQTITAAISRAGSVVRTETFDYAVSERRVKQSARLARRNAKGRDMTEAERSSEATQIQGWIENELNDVNFSVSVTAGADAPSLEIQYDGNVVYSRVIWYGLSESDARRIARIADRNAEGFKLSSAERDSKESSIETWLSEELSG